jgi:hypothetical protein
MVQRECETLGVLRDSGIAKAEEFEASLAADFDYVTEAATGQIDRESQFEKERVKICDERTIYQF